MANLGLLLLLLQMALMVIMPTMAVVTMEEEQYYSILNNKNMPSSSSSSSRSLDYSRSNKKYAVIFDAGSSGSRVHVFCFNRTNLGLVPVGNGTDLTLFIQTKPGLSAYANDPQAAAESLFPLLEKGESVVPKEFRPQTPLIVGATAGLRLLEGDKAEKILQAVRSLLANRSTLQFETKRVSILDGDQEGSYQWMTVNYLLGKLGKKYAETVGVVDLGGGSVQMAYAISNESAANAPPSSSDGENYVNKKILNGTEYYLYVHSYLNYGLLASRAQILTVSKNSSNPCILAGYNGFYTYGGVAYKASALASGSSLERCRTVILEALKVDEICKYKKCAFGGIWNGGGGSGQKKLYIASYFFDKAAQAGFIDASSPVAKVTPAHFKRAAAVACSSNYKDANSTFPDYYRPDLPYVCLDMTYLYSLLVHGFGIPPRKEITLVKQVQYHDSLLEAAWPLGNAIEAVSSLA